MEDKSVRICLLGSDSSRLISHFIPLPFIRKEGSNKQSPSKQKPQLNS